jgi:crossover junction endodeoxyribonuclease RusA
MATEPITFTVYGRPQQMGSKRAFLPKGHTRPIITDDNSKNRKQWANAVATSAGESMNGTPLILEPVVLRVRFYFARPKSHYGSGKNATRLKPSAPDRHSQSPDLDKLIRNVGDAITGVVIRDDKQIWRIESERHWTEVQERAEVEVFSADAVAENAGESL